MQTASNGKKRGRPARLSREQILNCALNLLEKGPAEVTISRVARELGTAPMSLYTHVNNRDDLLLGVSELVLGQLQVDINEQLSWQQQVVHWANQVHEHLRRFPQVVNLLSENDNVSAGWLRIHARLVHCLSGAGFGGPQLGYASRWLAQMVISDILMNNTHLAGQKTATMAALTTLEPADAAAIANIAAQMDSGPGDLLEFMLDRAICSLEQLL